jgi:hypothetical protein
MIVVTSVSNGETIFHLPPEDKCNLPSSAIVSETKFLDHEDIQIDSPHVIFQDKHTITSANKNILLLQGSIDLIGLNSLQLSDHDRSLLEHFITSQFHELKVTPPHFATDAFDETAHIVQWQEVVLDSYYRTGRGDHPVIDRVTFNIPIHVDAYRLSGLTNTTTTELITNFKRYIHHVHDCNLSVPIEGRFHSFKMLTETEDSEVSNFLIEDYILIISVLFGILLGFSYRYYCKCIEDKENDL